MAAPRNQPPSLHPEPTHVAVRTRGRPRFRRAGIDFEPNYTVIAIADLTPAQRKAIGEESMLECHVGTLDDMEGLQGDDATRLDRGSATIAELRQQLAAETKRADAAEAEVAKLRAKIVPNTPPPKAGEPPPQ